MAYKPRPKKTQSRTSCINLAMRVHITLWPVSLNQHVKHQLFSAPAGNRNDIDPSSFLQFSITMLFGGNLKYTNKLSLELPLQTHLAFCATTFHCHIVESKVQKWNSLLFKIQGSLCPKSPFSVAFEPPLYGKSLYLDFKLKRLLHLKLVDF